MNVLFDDWLVRDEKKFNSRLKEYRVLLTCCSIFSVILLVVTFFFWYICVFTFLFLVALTSVYFEYLKVKNNHLIIYEHKIKIINRFNKVKVLEYAPNQYSITLKEGIKRGAGLFLIFKDKEGRIISKYEDMINYPSLYQEDKTKWEIMIKEISCTINDPNEIIKN